MGVASLADVEIFRRVEGFPIQKAMALHYTTQAALEDVAAQAAGKAMGVLAKHRKTGAAQITVSQGNKVDVFVNLQDRTRKAKGYELSAWDIEHGTKRSRGIGALAKALKAMRKGKIYVG